MNSLIKADFRRMIRHKAVRIGLILVGIFVLISFFSMVLLNGLMGEEDAELLGGLLSGKASFASSFSISNNAGIMIPIIIAVLISEDFSYGTIRNKIICGHKRSSVYLSQMISSWIIGVGMLIIYALLMLGVTSLYIGYGKTGSVGSEIWFLLKTAVIGILHFSFICVITNLVVAISKNMAIAIIVIVALPMGMSIALSIIQLVELPKYAEFCLQLIPNYQNMNLISGSMSGTQEIIAIITNLIYLVAIPLLSIEVFKRKELK